MIDSLDIIIYVMLDIWSVVWSAKKPPNFALGNVALMLSIKWWSTRSNFSI